MVLEVGTARKRRPGHGTSHRKYFRRLRFEPLENRHLLTVFNVNLFSDVANFGPLTDGQVDVDSGTPGDQITLRAAIQEANALPGDDVIILPAGQYTLTLGVPIDGNPDDAEGDLDVTDTSGTLRITGAGANQTVIDAQGIVRVLEIYVNSELSLSGVTITGGIQTNVDGLGGGGIKNSGELNLTSVVVTGNQAVVGGGIWNTGDLFINGSVVSGNTTTGGGSSSPPFGEGGGIFSQGGTIFLSGSSVADNETPISGTGGGIAY